MRKPLLLITFLIPFLQVLAQQSTFSKVYYDASMTGVQANAIARDGNSFLVAGTAQSRDGLLLKIDSAGNLLWNKTYRYTQNFYPSIVFSAIIPTHDSCFILTGSSYDSTVSKNAAICMKVKANGDTVWTRLFERTGYSLEASSVQETNDSGFVITGHANTSGPPYNFIFVVKTDRDGIPQWYDFINSNGTYGSYGHAVKQSADSGFVISGSEVGSGGIFLKLNKTGNMSWANKYNNSSFNPCYFYDFLFVPGGYYIYSYNGSSVTLLKVNSAGSILWQKDYSGMGGGLTTITAAPRVRQRSPNEFYFFTESCGGSYLFKTDSVGNVVWQNMVMLNIADVWHTQDTGYIVAGNGPMCAIKSSLVTSPQIGLIKTDSMGSQQNCALLNGPSPDTNPLLGSVLNYTITSGGIFKTIRPVVNSITFNSHPGCVDWTGGVNDHLNNDWIEVFPSPTNKDFQIVLKGAICKEYLLYNGIGEVVKNIPAAGNETIANIQGLPPGIYILFAQTNKGFVSKRIAIE